MQARIFHGTDYLGIAWISAPVLKISNNHWNDSLRVPFHLPSGHQARPSACGAWRTRFAMRMHPRPAKARRTGNMLGRTVRCRGGKAASETSRHADAQPGAGTACPIGEGRKRAAPAGRPRWGGLSAVRRAPSRGSMRRVETTSPVGDWVERRGTRPVKFNVTLRRHRLGRRGLIPLGGSYYML